MAPETKRKSGAGSVTDLAESVAWLDCSGRPSSELYHEVEHLIQSAPAEQDTLILMLRHLERIGGSLKGFVLVLEKILRTAPMKVLLGDPSGYASLVLACLDRAPQFGVLRPDLALKEPQAVLIVDSSRPSAELLGEVLGAFGRSPELASTGIDARRLLRTAEFDLVLLDLDLPHTQSFRIAELVKQRRPATAIIGCTASDELWALENMARYGFLRILPKPLSILEFLKAIP